MKKSVNFYEFRNWFEQNRPNNFSSDGLVALWEMFESYEDDTGTELEFDPVAFCCEYTEYENIMEFWQDYDQEDYPDIDAIMDHTHVWSFGDESFIIQQF